jgi:hypothetical protein
MTTKHRAEELAEYLDGLFLSCAGKKFYFEDAKETAALLRTIPSLEADVERMKHDLQMALDVCLANQSWMIKLREFVNECK